jgi:hypothetical protein
VEFLRFATSTTTTALKGMEFAVGISNYDHTAHTVNASGNIDCVAGDTFWLLQEAHGDGLQVGQQAHVYLDPIIVQNYIHIGFQPMLLQPGANGTAQSIALVNMLGIAYTGVSARVEQRVHNFAMAHSAILDGSLLLSAPSTIDLESFIVRDSILYGTTAFPGSFTDADGWTLTNNHFIDGSDEGTQATTGALTFSTAYLSEDAAIEDRVWNSLVPYDLYGNARGTLSRLGAVDAAPVASTPDPDPPAEGYAPTDSPMQYYRTLALRRRRRKLSRRDQI